MIRPILLLSFFIAFTANNIAQEQQYRIWFNDKPESVHSVDEPYPVLLLLCYIIGCESDEKG